MVQLPMKRTHKIGWVQITWSRQNQKSDE